MLIVQIMSGNEKGRYLEKVLVSASKYADKILFLDDCSTDGTAEIAKSFSKVEYHLSPFGKSMFGVDEAVLRDYQWELTRKTAQPGDWVVSLDTDEEFDNNFIASIPSLIATANERDCDVVSVRLLDMWSETHFRQDGYWSPMISRLFRFKNFPFGQKGAIHTGCIPLYASQSYHVYARTDLRLKHFGWMRDEDKTRKYQFYMQRATGINLKHAKSIPLSPTLAEFKEELVYPTILIGSLIRNREWSLPQFLAGLELLDYPKDKIKFYFIVNDSTDTSLDLIKQWTEKPSTLEYAGVTVDTVNFGNTPHKDHSWDEKRLENMAIMRNRLLFSLGKMGCDKAFIIDSDVIIKHNELLKHLVFLGREVVSEVFWANWGRADQPLQPNVWVRGAYDISNAFINMLLKPGTYVVGGLGACTLIDKKVVDKGGHYTRVYNLPGDMVGEDRDFSIRAVCAGFWLWADTYYTPDHIEKEEISHVGQSNKPS